MSKIFPGYLTPLSDEALSSWLYRNALGNSSNSSASKILDWAVMQAKVKTHGDIDLLSSGEDFYLSFLPEEQARLATQMFGVQSDLLLHPETSLQFCHICLSNDIAKGHAPGFRRCWRYRGICVCNEHAAPVLLQTIQHQNASQYLLAWSGFVSYSLSMERATGCRDFVTYSTSSAVDKLRDAQVRLLVSRVQKKVFSNISKFRSTRPLAQRCGLELLINTLLQEPAEYFKGGCARWYLAESDMLWRTLSTSNNTSASDFFNHMDTARPRQIAVAYLMIGVACGMFTKRELQMLTDVFYYRPTPFPVTVHEISALIGNVQPARALRIAEAATECISQNELKSIRWILDSLPAV